MKKFIGTIKEILKYPSAIFGAIVVLALIVAAIVVVIKIPYKEAIATWQDLRSLESRNPRHVPPTWVNWFRKDKLVESLTLVEGDEGVTVEEETTKGGTVIKTFTFEIDYQYKTFPQALYLFFDAEYDEKQPFASVEWITPDGREIKLKNFGVSRDHTYPFNQDNDLKKKLNDVVPNIGLFIQEGDETQTVIPGIYQLKVKTTLVEEGSTAAPEFVMHGQVFGWAGTDADRRDLSLPILWGIPVALIFGLLAALGTSLLTMIIAAVGTWYGGIVDGLIQRITEINLVLPFLPILIMIGTFYPKWKTIWGILAVTIALSIFTGGIKAYRAMFMQIKESTYIEAAKAYGAKDGRLIFKYLIPRIIPLLIPGLVSAVPSYVFLEASLAVLGIGDPVLPTWGKTINDAQDFAALYKGLYYWILEPAALLMITGLGFAALGFALDRIFNPRLRGM